MILRRDVQIRSAAQAALSLLLVLAVHACAPSRPAPRVPGAPQFPEFIFPAPPAGLGSRTAVERHTMGWDLLQAGELRAAERQFGAALKQSADFYPSEAALGYVALARNDHREAVAHFDRVMRFNAAYAPALVGRGEALLALGDHQPALASFEAAVAADPGLAALRGRIEVLRFRGLQDDVAVARKAAETGRVEEARAAYDRAIAASPQSPFLYRELALLERKAGNLPRALEHARKARDLDPNEPRNFVLVGDIHEAEGEFEKAIEAFTFAAALEPGSDLTARIEALREKAAFAAMPEEYRSIEAAPTVTRAQLAALLGAQLDALLKRARRRATGVITDLRGNWAAPWILTVTRTGVMEPYPNHTFQPSGVVRRADLAAAASRVLSLIAEEKPRLAAGWRNPRRRFPDVAPGHLSHPAASLAVEAGVLTTTEDGSFQLTRLVTGAETVAAVKKLRALAESRAR
jgi:tetratricopeptide (TPR) repeat protein